MKLLVIPTTDLKNQLEELDNRNVSLVSSVAAKIFINIDEHDVQNGNSHMTNE